MSRQTATGCFGYLTVALHRLRDKGCPIAVVLIRARDGLAPVDGADLVLNDASGHLRERFGVLRGSGAYLVRPDHHVCAL